MTKPIGGFFEMACGKMPQYHDDFGLMYCQDTVALDQLTLFYHDMDSAFEPILSVQVNLQEYINKLYKNATLFECWDKNRLVGLVACYANDFITKKAHITSVAVLPEYHGRKISSTLLKNCLDYLVINQFGTVSLEVFMDNAIAKKLYNKMGFIAGQNNGVKLQMCKVL